MKGEKILTPDVIYQQAVTEMLSSQLTLSFLEILIKATWSEGRLQGLKEAEEIIEQNSKSEGDLYWQPGVQATYDALLESIRARRTQGEKGE